MSKTILCIVDVSPFIYSGAFTLHNELLGALKFSGEKYYQDRRRMGGVAYLLKKVYELRYSDIVFCFDSNPTIKKQMFADYKCNRRSDSKNAATIDYQRYAAFEILTDCGFPCYQYDGYEADDIAYSVWKTYQNVYDEVRVYAGDSDYYCMVNEKTSVHPVNSRDRLITFENFPTTCYTNRIIPYNLITPEKILYGDTSDCIPPFPNVALCHKLFDLMARHPFKAHFGHKEIFESFIKEYIDETAQQPFLDKADLTYPILTDVPFTPHERTQDIDQLTRWGQALAVYAYGAASTHPSLNEKIENLFKEV